MKKIFLITVIMTIVFSTSYFPNPSFRTVVAASSPEEKMEKVIKGFESKIPIAEKQTELLIKLLSAEKHRNKLIADIENLKTQKLQKFGDSYLYQVFEKLKIPFEAGRVKTPPLRGQKTAYRHLLFPRSLVVLAYGWGVINQKESKPFINSKQSERISIIVNQLIELQQAYISEATDNLPEINFGKLGYTDPVKKPKNDRANSYLGVFFHTDGERKQPIDRHRPLWAKEILSIFDYRNKKGHFDGLSIEYLNSLQKMNEFFSEIGFQGKWLDDGILGRRIESIIEKKASMKDLDDLGDLTSDAPAAPEEDDGLSLDDLSLPE